MPKVTEEVTPVAQQALLDLLRSPCRCVNCMQGRNKALESLGDTGELLLRLAYKLEYGSDAEKVQLKQLLALE